MGNVLSVNQMAWKIAQKLIDNPEFYGVTVSKSIAGATIIDAGVNAPGGFQAGKKLTELCLGGAGKATIGLQNLRRSNFPINYCYLRSSVRLLCWDHSLQGGASKNPTAT